MSHRAVADVVVGGVPSVRVKAQCDSCKGIYFLDIPEDQWLSWKSGELIQNAIPYLNADERELLISDICGKCFDALWQHDDEPDSDDEEVPF